eukprot:5033656-Amphidinium_carterae.3
MSDQRTEAEIPTLIACTVGVTSYWGIPGTRDYPAVEQSIHTLSHVTEPGRASSAGTHPLLGCVRVHAWVQRPIDQLCERVRWSPPGNLAECSEEREFQKVLHYVLNIVRELRLGARKCIIFACNQRKHRSVAVMELVGYWLRGLRALGSTRASRGPHGEHCVNIGSLAA